MNNDGKLSVKRQNITDIPGIFDKQQEIFASLETCLLEIVVCPVQLGYKYTAETKILCNFKFLKRINYIPAKQNGFNVLNIQHHQNGICYTTFLYLFRPNLGQF